ncbi:beta-lactamase/transpeptidase-like protein [Trametes versicolor FP-101664 SS1]|uniref:beta-lactamase/transpeptidase-like protein n=1 Tax=Trametes versicolor (strain FP-101664) TaxID=717944 RepID=UPI0004621347|nr:beta-lactamase/transpeptidase-like protein [Trametes versicolor FP-101664 SS1]EIW63119.1 beta-lactamase/transpeptidase-like protein [Trametes versicolor FP-101664 SS1]
MRSDGSILSPAFHAFVDEVRENASVPGISVGVVRLSGDNTKPQVELASWGRKTEDGDANDLTTDAFLATSVGLLIDDFAQGRNVTPLPAGTARLDWDTKIAAILPDEWLLDDEWTTRAASIRDVLGHVSGMPRHDFSYAVGDTAQDIVLRMRHLRTAYELREKYSYNNQMFMLGAHIVAKYANTSYPAFVTERLFKPLNMSSTSLWPSEAHASGKLSQAWTRTGRRTPFWFTDEAVPLNAGAGGIISSAEDMARTRLFDQVNWLAVLLNKGVDPGSGDIVFPRSVYDAVTTAQYIVSGRPTEQYGAGIVGYGMGWTRWTYGDIEMVMHTGGIPGFTTFTTFSPSSNLGVIILINADEQATPARAILKRAFDDVLGRASSAFPFDEAYVRADEEPPRLDDDSDAASEPASLDLSAYTGTYTSPGYGTLTLCAPSAASNASTTATNTTTASASCPDVLAAFASLGPVAPGLYGAYPRVFATHVRLAPLPSDSEFALTLTALFPHGYGADTRAFELWETGESEGRVRFEQGADGVPVGFALFIDDEAVAARRRRKGGDVREAADAWFARVSA